MHLLLEEVWPLKGCFLLLVFLELFGFELELVFGCKLERMGHAFLQFEQKREDGLVDLDRAKHFHLATLFA